MFVPLFRNGIIIWPLGAGSRLGRLSNPGRAYPQGCNQIWATHHTLRTSRRICCLSEGNSKQDDSDAPQVQVEF